ncbi:hypothetical protein QYM36_008809 [Artemia franciscana]|uniref:Uncharacterized protein n=1 Tax=Artemia franciscana TaxID=6661 RepID=A0AA88HPY7_ARTSF|nr:hypothetical protein QYM36_008809 [Artemia franciscana]
MKSSGDDELGEEEVVASIQSDGPVGSKVNTQIANATSILGRLNKIWCNPVVSWHTDFASNHHNFELDVTQYKGLQMTEELHW